MKSLVEDEDFSRAAPFLFGSGFEKKAKERTEAEERLRERELLQPQLQPVQELEEAKPSAEEWQFRKEDGTMNVCVYVKPCVCKRNEFCEKYAGPGKKSRMGKNTTYRYKPRPRAGCSHS